jgi:pimeloyl-ACP methyl ester carboxylesterase
MAAGFREGFVEADGFRIRYMGAGEGPALVHLHRAGGLRLTPAHELLSRGYRVVAFEIPGFGASPENTRTRDDGRRRPSPRPRPLQPKLPGKRDRPVATEGSNPEATTDAQG